jgi:predicted RNA-binding Zn-ribbon protein involved in translation (DUF1610 family)
MKTMTMRNLGPALLCIAFAACSTEKIYTNNHQLLAESLAHLERSEYPATEAKLREVLVATGDVAREYELQRFFAEYLLARMHLEAYFADRPYLTEPAPGRGRDDVRQRPSPDAHLIAATYHGAYGLDRGAAAADDPPTVEGQVQLPPALAELGVANATRYIDLCLVTIYSRFQFQDKVGRVLDAFAEPHQLEDPAVFDGLIAGAGISEAMRPWIYHAVYERLRTRKDNREAYRFACKILDTPRDVVEAHFDVKEIASIEAWILVGSGYDFICPNCDNVMTDPASKRCTSCRKEDRIDFLPQFKTPAAGTK